eukprot:4420466-Prymnesium_polylepis.1
MAHRLAHPRQASPLQYDELVATSRALFLSPNDLRGRIMLKGKAKLAASGFTAEIRKSSLGELGLAQRTTNKGWTTLIVPWDCWLAVARARRRVRSLQMGGSIELARHIDASQTTVTSMQLSSRRSSTGSELSSRRSSVDHDSW